MQKVLSSLRSFERLARTVKIARGQKGASCIQCRVRALPSELENFFGGFDCFLHLSRSEVHFDKGVLQSSS